MCFASPKAQVDPSRPANYPVDQSYGQVTMSTTDVATGKTTGGKTISEEHNSPTTVTPVDSSPRQKTPTRRDHLAAGANIRM